MVGEEEDEKEKGELRKKEMERKEIIQDTLMPENRRTHSSNGDKSFFDDPNK